jgi:hypothetical protein
VHAMRIAQRPLIGYFQVLGDRSNFCIALSSAEKANAANSPSLTETSRRSWGNMLNTPLPNRRVCRVCIVDWTPLTKLRYAASCTRFD